MGFTRYFKTRGEVSEFLGTCGTEWEMAATSPHDDVSLDSEERHERTANCTSAYRGSLVGRVASARCVEVAAKVSSRVGRC